MNKLAVMREHILTTDDLKCPVCGTVDDLEEFVVHFCRCKMCRSDLVVIEADEPKEP